MSQTLSPDLLDPHINLTSEETQWRDVSLWYQQVAYDEFQFTDRMKYFCVRYLLDMKKCPYRSCLNRRWTWHDLKDETAPNHSRVMPVGFFGVIPENYLTFHNGHNSLGNSILWFTSLWPRFYVEVVLPTQEGEPENPEEFWENLGLKEPGENGPVRFLSHNRFCFWSNRGRWQIEVPADLFDINKILHYRDDPHYRWTYGNAVLRSIKAWRGDKE